MKTTFKFIIAAMAASAVFASCQKELAIENPAGSTDGIRVISASFSAPTKSTLDTDGKTPKFVGGETIKVSNATASENCTISVSGGVATFSTTLTGELTAVYPSTAAKMNGGIIDPTAVLVSTVQDGTFANANIAMATGITTSATFTNKTAVIKIVPGAGMSTKYVEVITAGPQIANTASGEYTKLNKIHVATTSADAVYVSILVPTGLKVRDLSFADGHNIKTAKDNTTAIAINTISTVTATGWDKPYVEINGLKWATMNIGATSSTDYGYYFFWGGTEGYKRVGSIWYKASDYTEIASGGFAKANDPHYNGSAYTKYTGTSGDGKTTLDLADDAANANWGGSWRMPTEAEFEALKSLQKGDFASGYHFGGDTEEAQIFLPAAGFGEGAGLIDVGFGHYWSSSLYTGEPDKACFSYFSNYDNYTSSSGRYRGQPVRALSE